MKTTNWRERKTTKKLCKIFVIEYREEDKTLVEKLLNSNEIKDIALQINTEIGEITLPYDGPDDDYIEDIIDFLIEHSGNTELIKILSKNKTYLPILISEFKNTRDVLIREAQERKEKK